MFLDCIASKKSIKLNLNNSNYRKNKFLKLSLVKYLLKLIVLKLKIFFFCLIKVLFKF